MDGCYHVCVAVVMNVSEDVVAELSVRYHG